jgi:hypothetical protein
MKDLTLEYLRDMRKACYWHGDKQQGIALEPRLPMTVAQLVDDTEIPAADKLWVLLHRDFFSDSELRLLACDFAEAVLPIYESARPGDFRPRHAIKVSRRYAVGEATAEELSAARESVREAARAAAGAAGTAASTAAGAEAKQVAWDTAWTAAGEAAEAANQAARAARAAWAAKEACEAADRGGDLI